VNEKKNKTRPNDNLAKVEVDIQDIHAFSERKRIK
jgi:hypothetical protein